MSGALLQVLGGLVLIVALMFGSAWIFRRSGGLKLLQQGPLRVVGGVRVGARERVVLLEIADTWLVVGVAAGQVSALHTLPRQPGSESPGADPASSPFPAWLARFGGTPGGPR